MSPLKMGRLSILILREDSLNCNFRRCHDQGDFLCYMALAESKVLVLLTDHSGFSQKYARISSFEKREVVIARKIFLQNNKMIIAGNGLLVQA